MVSLTALIPAVFGLLLLIWVLLPDRTSANTRCTLPRWSDCSDFSVRLEGRPRSERSSAGQPSAAKCGDRSGHNGDSDADLHGALCPVFHPGAAKPHGIDQDVATYAN